MSDEEQLGRILTSMPRQIDAAYRDGMAQQGCAFALCKGLINLFLLAAFPFQVIFHAFMGVREIGPFKILFSILWFGIAALYNISMSSDSRYDESTGVFTRSLPDGTEEVFVGFYPQLYLWFAGLFFAAIVFRTWQRERWQKRGLPVHSRSMGCMARVWRHTKLPDALVLVIIEPAIVFAIAYYSSDIDRLFSGYAYVACVSLFILNAFMASNLRAAEIDQQDRFALMQDEIPDPMPKPGAGDNAHPVRPGPTSRVNVVAEVVEQLTPEERDALRQKLLEGDSGSSRELPPGE